MLRRLFIQNYAIIDEIDIQFSGRLNIITGETGAGKSILMGALSLILGNRADSSVLLNQQKKCVIEGMFDILHKNPIREFLRNNDLDTGEELLIRREIAANGKSRAFINDTPVNLEQLRQATSLLVDLHQQFDTLELGESDFQREVLDAMACNADLLKSYQSVFLNLTVSQKKLQQLQDQKQQFQKEFDYHQFLFNELEEASLKDNELEDLESELKLLENAEGIKNTLQAATYQLQENDEPIVQQLKSLHHQLHAYESYHQELPALMQRLQSAQIELQDIAGELERLNDDISHDPKRIERINERISLGYKLLKKHGVQSTADLLLIQKALEEKLQAVLNIDEAISLQEKETSALLQQCRQLAGQLHAAREKQVKPLEKQVNVLLAKVGMPNAALRIKLQQVELNMYGQDAPEFLFDANNTGQLLPLRKVASGGELSRLMLCIKSLVAEKIDLPTMIFDEIDSGISGEAARQVGIIMHELAAMRQVICITHQPQIAGRAHIHFYVYKEIVQHAVKTNIRQLSQEERITAIAKMLSGEKPTAAALENAREMVMN
ncbi:MAG TPA: DNA repair protein RecN [Chitinophagaceae bacterium]|nr:DNA repair protein RecN [Chitinophagaceae bacterium]